MNKGRKNVLTGQIGEYLVCAELAKRNLIATSFTGNVPEIDILIVNDKLKTLPIQVKTSRGDSFPSKANKWMDIEIDESQEKQIYKGDLVIENPDLIYVYVILAKVDSKNRDRFFILQKKDLQSIYIKGYKKFMNEINWKRPKNYMSLDNRCYLKELIPFEDNWDLINSMLNNL